MDAVNNQPKELRNENEPDNNNTTNTTTTTTTTTNNNNNNNNNSMENHNALLSQITQRLNQELSLSTTQRQKVESQWIQILRKEKFDELHAEISTLRTYHDQNVERKKGVINSIEREMDHLQELYHKAMVANIFRMEELINIYDDQVISSERDFHERVDLMQKEFREYVQYVKVQYDCEKDLIHQSIQVQEQKENYQREVMKQEQHHELEEIKNRNLEDINSLRFQLDSKVELLEEQFEQAHIDFAQMTDFTKAAYDQLKKKDDRMRKDIGRKTRKADRICNEIQKFRLIAKQEEVQIRDRHSALLQRKSRAIHRYQMTKDEMNAFRKEQQKKLVDLSRVANERKEELRRQCALADRVKKIAIGCSKLETDREEFASLLRDSLHAEQGQREFNANDGSSSQVHVHVVEVSGDQYELNDSFKQRSLQLVNDEKNVDTASIRRSHYPYNNQKELLWDTTHKFWDKFNMAHLDVLTLEKRVDRLKRREKELKDKFKRYHDGITVNDDVLKNPNPLLVINGRMNVVPENSLNMMGGGHGGYGTKMRRLTVVDGNHIFATHISR